MTDANTTTGNTHLCDCNTTAEAFTVSPASSPAVDGFAQIQVGHKISPRAVTAEQETVLADLALTVPQKSQQGMVAAMATILSGRLNDLEPEDFRQTMTTLVKNARPAGNELDVIGGLYGLTRGTTVSARGQFRETDVAFADRLVREVPKPVPPSAADQLVGISLRTVLHFCPQATFAQQETAIEKTVKAVEGEVVLTEVDQTFRVNELWLVVRFICQDIVIDVGEPNRPFEEILLWREGKSEPLLGNYIVKPGERLVVEPSSPAPIDIRPAGGCLY